MLIINRKGPKNGSASTKIGIPESTQVEATFAEAPSSC